MTSGSQQQALEPTPFIDSDSQIIREFAAEHAGAGNDRERAVRLYYAVRDAIRYDLRFFAVEPETFVASRCLHAAGSFCVPKAVTLAAAARAVGIPARIGFADVRNHLASQRILELMGTDVFRWHAYTLLWLDGAWVKATPAFDRGFCERFDVAPLDFDGRSDSVFQPFDATGRRHMEYVSEHGHFDDMPFVAFRDEMLVSYPRLIAAMAEERRERALRDTPQQG